MIGGEFKRKKIDSLTLGERMKRIRCERRLSINEVARNTKIQGKYLEYLENGEYEKLPADVYVRGFLKSYASFVGINEKSLVKIYEREQGIRKNIHKIEIEDKQIEPVKISKWVITPKIILGSLIVSFVFLGIFYLYREIDSFVSEPRLIILTPQDGEVTEERKVLVKGLAESDANIFINGQPVLAGENGEFEVEIGLHEGLNNIRVSAKNRFEKESERSVTVQGNFQEAIPGINETQENMSEGENTTMGIEISSRAEPVWLSVESDGAVVYSGTLQPESVQKFEAKEAIKISSAKGNQVYVKINGKDLGALGDGPEIVKDKVFKSEDY